MPMIGSEITLQSQAIDRDSFLYPGGFLCQPLDTIHTVKALHAVRAMHHETTKKKRMDESEQKRELEKKGLSTPWDNLNALQVDLMAVFNGSG